MAAQVLADDGKYDLWFEGGMYVAGCHRFYGKGPAISHWTARSKIKGDCTGLLGEPVPGCKCAVDIRKRARLFLKAIKKHAAEQSQ